MTIGNNFRVMAVVVALFSVGCVELGSSGDPLTLHATPPESGHAFAVIRMTTHGMT